MNDRVKIRILRPAIDQWGFAKAMPGIDIVIFYLVVYFSLFSNLSNFLILAQSSMCRAKGEYISKFRQTVKCGSVTIVFNPNVPFITTEFTKLQVYCTSATIAANYGNRLIAIKSESLGLKDKANCQHLATLPFRST